ncbi:hypothetical protein M3Y97_01147100 [Aphelenchoides bicaudatus]|nr:hypothetical protein M3Y97_01147100 [Aphelenchoides bicaudatus]
MTARASSGLAKTYGTTILFQHNGLPRTPFYVQQHLKGLYENLGVPSSISGQLADLRCRYSKKIKSALRESGNYLPLNESHRRFGAELSKKLGEVLPEFGPYTTRFSYLYDVPSIATEIQQIAERGADRLIVTSLYPFEMPHLVNPMKKATTSALNKSFSKIENDKSGRVMYNAKGRPVSFDFERIDAVGSHPSFEQYWSERILNKIGKEDALIFAVPMPSLLNQHKFFETVHESADRIMLKIHSRFKRAVSFRVAFYPMWNHSLLSYPLSKAVHKQISMLACFERHDPLVVPFGSFFKDFDTEYMLPTNYPEAKILRPEESDSNLVHSFVELLKTRILMDKYQADKVPLDPLF